MYVHRISYEGVNWLHLIYGMICKLAPANTNGTSNCMKAGEMFTKERESDRLQRSITLRKLLSYSLIQDVSFYRLMFFFW